MSLNLEIDKVIHTSYKLLGDLLMVDSTGLGSDKTG